LNLFAQQDEGHCHPAADVSSATERSEATARQGLWFLLAKTCLSRGGYMGLRPNEKGQLIRAVITGGQVHDSQAIPALFEPDLNAPLAIVADKAYGSKAIRQQIADEGALAVIPSKSNAKTPTPHDPNLYAMRNIVERFFCTLSLIEGNQLPGNE
jgi:transposase